MIGDLDSLEPCAPGWMDGPEQWTGSRDQGALCLNGGWFVLVDG